MNEPATDDWVQRWLKKMYERQLATLLQNAANNGFVITVEHTYPSPLDKPVMIGEVRAARGFY